MMEGRKIGGNCAGLAPPLCPRSIGFITDSLFQRIAFLKKSTRTRSPKAGRLSRARVANVTLIDPPV